MSGFSDVFIPRSVGNVFLCCHSLEFVTHLTGQNLIRAFTRVGRWCLCGYRGLKEGPDFL